jgi:hypothetical protein
MKHTKIQVMSFLALAVLMGSSSSFADFKQRHPRRYEVNQREKNQQRRIASGIASGKMSAQQAQHIEGQEAAIKSQEVADVKANGGYLTKPEQRQLNRELNGVSKEIYTDKH